MSPLLIFLFGAAFGVCLPTLASLLRAWYRRTWFRPTLLHLDRPGRRPDKTEPTVDPVRD